MALAFPAAAAGGMSFPTAAGLLLGMDAAKKFKEYVLPKRPRKNYSRIAKRARLASSKKVHKTRKKRRRRKKRTTLKKKVRRLQKVTNTLAKSVDTDTGTVTIRHRNTGQITSSINLQSSNVFMMNSKTDIETYPCSKLYYYDPNTPGTLQNADFTSGTYSKELQIVSSGMILHLRNNSTGNVNVKVYIVHPKDDTGSSPNQMWDSADADSPTTVDKTYIGARPNSHKVFTAAYTAKTLWTGKMTPGQSQFFKNYEPAFKYNPAFADVNVVEYQRQYRCFGFMVIISGDLCHDTTTSTLVGRAPATLDWEAMKAWKVKYSAGVNLKYTSITNDYDTVVAAEEAQKPKSEMVANAV